MPHPLRKPTLLLPLLIAVAASAHEFSGPHGSVTVDWEVANVSRVLSSGYGDSFGIEAAVKMGFPETETIEGRQCVNGSYFLVDVSDDFAFDIDETVTLNILLDRRRSTGLWVSYDRNALAEPLQQITFDDSSERWHRQTVVLERARFANRGEAGADFALAAPSAVWPGTPGADHRVVICDIEIVRSNKTATPAASGTLLLQVSSDAMRRAPVRVGIYDESGRMPLPSDAALTISNYDDLTKQVFLRATHGSIAPWPHANRHFFYSDGEYVASLPAGSYTLIVTKGPEYRVVKSRFDIAPGEQTRAAVALQRWVDMPARGWYSGDDHVHMTRAEQDNETISSIMQAEDVHVTNVLQMGNPFDTHFRQYAFGEAGRYLKDHHALVPGVEDPRTAVRGHTISLNIKDVYRPAEKYLSYEEIFAAYRQQGGMSGYAHVAGELFNVARGLALDVPLGAVDFVEILQDGTLSTALWYDFLNLGFALVPTAGSDFPYLSAPGGERNYVQVEGEFRVDKWYEALQQNRTFVSNGPMLELNVAGQEMGSWLSIAPGDELAIVATATMDPAGEPLDRLELVVHGEVVATADNVSSDNSIRLSHTLVPESGVWLAVRTYGTKQALAHSAPVFVTTGGGYMQQLAAPTIVAEMLARLDEFDALVIEATAELEPWSVKDLLAPMYAGQQDAIRARVDAARRAYLRILDNR